MVQLVDLDGPFVALGVVASVEGVQLAVVAGDDHLVDRGEDGRELVGAGVAVRRERGSGASRRLPLDA